MSDKPKENETMRVRCNCGELLPLTTTGPAHVCPTIDKTVSLNADSRPLVTKSYHLGANDAEPISDESLDALLAELPIWATAWVRCAVCDHRHTSVHIHDIERVECPKCGHMTLVEDREEYA